MSFCECGCGQPAPIAKKTCSRDGYRKGDSIRFIHGHQNKGENNGQWIGGDYTKNARSMVRVNDGRTKKGYVAFYRIIAEKALGKPLPPNAVVHHHNGIQTDDRNSNLVICQDSSYHSYIHKRQRAYEATANPTALKCKFCKQWGTDLKLSKGGNFHSDCMNTYNRKRREIK